MPALVQRCGRLSAAGRARGDATAPPGERDACCFARHSVETDLGQAECEIECELARKIIENVGRSLRTWPNPTSSVGTAFRLEEILRGVVGCLPPSPSCWWGAYDARRESMYNHFGYRPPIANLYMAGSTGHPGGAVFRAVQALVAARSHPRSRAPKCA